jgi:hypothetical protein
MLRWGRDWSSVPSPLSGGTDDAGEYRNYYTYDRISGVPFLPAEIMEEAIGQARPHNNGFELAAIAFATRPNRFFLRLYPRDTSRLREAMHLRARMFAP